MKCDMMGVLLGDVLCVEMFVCYCECILGVNGNLVWVFTFSNDSREVDIVHIQE